MSYCRKHEDISDLYVFEALAAVVCCFCILHENQSQEFALRSEAVAHIRAHELAGHLVPGSVIWGLEQTIEEKGDAVMPDPEERAALKMEEAGYSPSDEEEAKKRIMISEIVDVLNTASSRRVAVILDQIKTDYDESETWHDDGPTYTETEREE